MWPWWADPTWAKALFSTASWGAVWLSWKIYPARLEIGFTLTGTVNGQPVVVDSGAESVTVTAPLPDVVVRAGHQFGDNFYLGFTGGWFSLKYQDIDGELISARANFEWRPVKHFGAGIGYQYVGIKVTEDDGDKKHRLDNDIYGPVLYVSAGF